MLSPVEAFRFGFLARCADAGLGPRETAEVSARALTLMKQAGVLNTLLGKTLDIGKGLGTSALSYGIPLAVTAPIIGGGLAGYGLAKATDVSDEDVEAVKDKELLEEYRHQTDKLHRNRAVRDFQLAKQKSPVRPLI